ncbi:hypothetical protein [Cupriavidus consociatus]|uniref:hypothetical protein n=1 Tax=Cupriavidus consociatus TaxID=2821357 RepID=UPI001AE20D77|nr:MULTISPECIES: hypothetical protein [unclassified Cupriavidus]MBP0623915.1 hypothetical protein [Cupriavidus sp. LEh25]MDK2660623.1 hypothetical protein [Cupriavidus sp. LEh21]
MSDIKVVHISQTPLVGAPSKIAAATRMAGYYAHAICMVDYPAGGGLAGKFVNDSIVMHGAPPVIEQLVDRIIGEAHIVHVHNEIPLEKAEWLLDRATKARFVYQVHSPVREGPLYIPRADELGLPFTAHLVVGQYQPRHYPSYKPVPNIVLDAPSCAPREEGQKLRVMFSPTHARSGRWNAKYSKKLEVAIESLTKMGLIEAIWPEQPVSPNVLMALRRTCHVSIDEIVTGAFHQVSMEGLCAGNVVINRADYFSKAMMATCAGASELPPFVYADDENIAGVLVDLARDWKKTAELQAESSAYFMKYLRPQSIVKSFVKAYREII